MIYNDKLTKRDMYMYRRGEMREYIRNRGILSPEIHQQLLQWVDAGHDVHENPWGIRSIETGWPCDYLEAMKIMEDRKNWMAELKAKRK